MTDSGSGSITIGILETSDVHGNILPINYANNQESELGLAKISTLIRRERERHPNLLVIDNGDLIQGTPLAYYHARIDNEPVDPLVKVLNYLQYDAAVLGNHEFNYGQDVLMKAIRESDFPWMSANIVKSGTTEPYFGKPYLIKEFAEGVRVGVLGLTTQYIPNWENPRHIEGTEFLDAVESAKKWVPVLRDKEQADLVVVSYHGGFERDLETGTRTEQLTGENQGFQLCMEVPGIDVLLTGHQHRSIAGMTVNGVAVIQPGHQARALGKVTVTLVKHDGRWRVVNKKSDLLSVENIEADPVILEMVSAYEEKTQIWLDKPIGKIKGDMRVTDPMAIRLRDNPLIEFFNKVQMEYAQTDISNTALFDNHSPGLGTDVTMRDIVANYIYPNTLRVLRITGQDIKDALEQSASYFATYTGGDIQVNPEFTTPKPQHYNYDMWEGIEYRINISRPFGERVEKLTYKGQPVQMDRLYEVVMNNYRAGGGGNYFMFQGKEVVRDVPTDVSELIANYILERGTIEATCDHNWEVVHN
ncbi:bifunctional metallophosphatase/5'-nucleotidase [Effusibacillus lacus]|uniref:2',3'-cyclic-nucleotide 2'-phosphodiesterase n=1 Tax=Effusibacillus lacus TaxID=1348429 RepID=A0A292YRW1_9BACL|nr:bifunctional metallophosphatase/5'-nucleotidase [Effusibacillus lacus]TCS76882.1 2',3'-cyclic-nucleotide 2'-phosphodiesterase/3'-nucleotidase [Effusibacillus lacus]GAX91215.1 2',3'-cyclic-nucleotide 2'-phosphodiesterase [Effusibacillus lacus]